MSKNLPRLKVLKQSTGLSHTNVRNALIMKKTLKTIKLFSVTLQGIGIH